MSNIIPQKTHDAPARHSTPDRLIVVAGGDLTSYIFRHLPSATRASTHCVGEGRKPASYNPTGQPSRCWFCFCFPEHNTENFLDRARS